MQALFVTLFAFCPRSGSCQQLCLQNGDGGFHVREPIRERELDELVERVHLHIQELSGVETSLAPMQAAREIDVQHLAAVAWRGILSAERRERVGGQARFLLQLPARGILGRLARLRRPKCCLTPSWDC